MVSSRRELLASLGAAGLAALAGCSDLLGGDDAPDNPTGLDDTTGAALDGTPVYLAGNAGSLPDPPTKTDSLSEARVAIATPDADPGALADALAGGTTVAFAGDGAADALQGVLKGVGDDYRYGTETVKDRPVAAVVAVPRSSTLDTFHFVDEGGWDDPVLDSVGWTFSSSIPECQTTVPSTALGAGFSSAGTATVAGRLGTGETYLSRTTAQVRRVDDGGRRVRFDTAMHAARVGGYATARARRVADVANDETVDGWYPETGNEAGLSMTNRSDLVENRLDVAFEPTTDESRADFTGCCGFNAAGTVGYDHQTTWAFEKDTLLESDRRTGGGIGRGEWHVDTK